ncbi:hypothetical protein MYX04_13950 [Nitrospiraceae bacterium AH_259_D15_M11_P09]|nr:hypothetical protein [Nitrospiraceae bacterium AH_259_D15_M11_P09]
MDFLVSAWTEYLQPLVSPFWDSLVVLRGVSLVLLSLLALAFYQRKRLAEWVLGVSRGHDVAIFRKLDALANEARVDDILNGRIYTKYLTTEDRAVLYKLNDELQRIENQYLDRGLRQQGREFAQKLGALLGLVGSTFWSVGEDRLKFRPDRIDPEVYDREWNELNLRIDGAWNAYKIHRTTVKEKLHL